MYDRIDLNHVPDHLIARARADRQKSQQMEEKLSGRGLYKVVVEGTLTLYGRFTVFVAATDAISAENAAQGYVEDKDQFAFDPDVDSCNSRVKTIECLVKPTTILNENPEVLEEA